MAAGAGLAAFSLLAVVFAARHGRPADVAWVEAALAAGSAVGGLALGAIDWRAPARTRLTLLTAALGTALALAALAPTLPALTAVAALVGLAVAPTLTTAYLRTDELATPAERTRAGCLGQHLLQRRQLRRHRPHRHPARPPPAHQLPPPRRRPDPRRPRLPGHAASPPGRR